MTISFVEAFGKVGTTGYQSVTELMALADSVSGKVESAPSGSTFLLSRQIQIRYTKNQNLPL